MKSVCIVFDKWQFSIFEKHIIRGGFDFDCFPGPTSNTLTFNVTAETAGEVMPYYQAAKTEAARMKQHN